MMIDNRTASISDETWAKVFFNSMNKLTTTSLFLDARGAIISTAKSLGFNQLEQQAIKDAFDAVGITEPDAIRIVLRWGAYPSDLDSHLTGPTTDGSGKFHVYYGSPNYIVNNSNNSLLAADLDYDDTSSYGPEITTIHTLTPGDYYFYVHDYSNRSNASSTSLSNSDVTVTLYRGASNTPLKLPDGSTNARFTINSTAPGTLWAVCKINIDSSGNVAIAPLNALTHQSNPGAIGG